MRQLVVLAVVVVATLAASLSASAAIWDKFNGTQIGCGRPPYFLAT
jgi:hypothetical protein